MMGNTKIDYLTKSWNPIAMRCTRVSSGCDHCWHLKMAARHAGNSTIRKAIRDARAGGPPWLNEEELDAPLRWKAAQIVGVQFMGDLFHEQVSDKFIGLVFGTIADAHHHTFIVLTKRAERLEEWSRNVSHYPNGDSSKTPMPGWPRNAIVGVSVEHQQAAHERIPHLLRTPAAKRWISVEPMLGPIDMAPLFDKYGLDVYGNDGAGVVRLRCEKRHHRVCADGLGGCGCGDWPAPIDWVVCGGESGPGARLIRAEWVRDLRDQCKTANIPFWFKQWGNSRELDGEGAAIDGVVWHQRPGGKP